MIDTISIGSIRLQRRVRDDGLDRVTVEVEINEEWVEVICELHANYFDHFVSPNGMRAALAKATGTSQESATPASSSTPSVTAGLSPPLPLGPTPMRRGTDGKRLTALRWLADIGG